MPPLGDILLWICLLVSWYTIHCKACPIDYWRVLTPTLFRLSKEVGHD